MNTFSKPLFLGVSCFLFCLFFVSCGDGKNEIPKEMQAQTSNNMTKVLAPLEEVAQVATGTQDQTVEVSEWLALGYDKNIEELYRIETLRKEASNTLTVNSKLVLPLLYKNTWYNRMLLDLEKFFPESKSVKNGKKQINIKFPAFVRKKSIEQMDLLLQKIVDCLNQAKPHESSHYPAPDLKQAKQGNVFCEGKAATALSDIFSKAWTRDSQVPPQLKVLKDFKKLSLTAGKIVAGENQLLESMNLIGIVCEKKNKTCVLASVSNEQ